MTTPKKVMGSALWDGIEAEKKKRKTVRQIEEDAKSRFTVHIPISVQEKVRNAVYWDRSTIAEFAERAFLRELGEMTDSWGGEYDERKRELTKGRKVKTPKEVKKKK